MKKYEEGKDRRTSRFGESTNNKFNKNGSIVNKKTQRYDTTRYVTSCQKTEKKRNKKQHKKKQKQNNKSWRSKREKELWNPSARLSIGQTLCFDTLDARRIEWWNAV
eukprot:m.227998 g.227998  ORF g.227998 m.227998 type:complete len:107 (-) comp33533_c0_seq3:1901-2221(-)